MAKLKLVKTRSGFDVLDVDDGAPLLVGATAMDVRDFIDRGSK